MVLTDEGWQKVQATAPGHVGTVRALVLDTLDPTQVARLGELCELLLGRLDPDHRMLDFDRFPAGAATA